MSTIHSTLAIDADARRPLDWRFGIALAVAFLAALLPRLYAHDLWRDEWHVWLLCRDSPDLATMIARIHYDGHPVTWYVITWLAGRVWDDPMAMKAAHAAIATAVILVVGVAAPFPRWQRLLLACGYFLTFEYAVISRNYALGVLGLFLAVACQARRPTRPVATCAALALVVHSNGFAALVGLTFAAFFALGWWLDARVSRKSLFAGLAIVAASFVLVVIETRPPPDLVNTPWRFDVDVDRAGRLAAAVWRCVVPIPLPTRRWWGTNLLDPTLHLGLLRVAPAVAGVITLGVLLRYVSRDNRLRLLLLASIAVVVAFAYTKITGSLRHHGTFFAAFVAIRWLDQARATSADDRFGELVWRATLVVQAIAGVAASAADVFLPFTAAPAVARYIEEHYPNAQVITQRDFEGCSIAGFLGRPVYFPVPGRWATYIIYNDQRSERADSARLEAIAAKLHAADPSRPVILAVSEESIDRPDETKFRFLIRLGDASMSSERYNLLEWPANP